MNKTIVVYGSTTGTCEDLAGRIAGALGVDEVVNVADLTDEQIAEADNLVLGSSTWGAGDLQDDWYDGVEKLRAADLSGKKVAIFGCGDSESYPDTFCGAMGEIYNAAVEAGAEVIGQVSAADYSFDDSAAVVDGQFVGLALDEVNQSDQTDDRIAAWAEAVAPQL